MSLPQFWITTCLENIVVDTQPGFAQRPNQENIGVPQLRTNNVSVEGNLDLSEVKYVDADDAMIEKYGVQKGDIIFNNTNSPDLVGKTAFFDIDDAIYVISNHMTRIRVDPELVDAEYLARFLHYLWKSGASKSWAKQWVNQAAIDQPSLWKFDVILPPLPEQRHISAILRQANMLYRWRKESNINLSGLLPILYSDMFGKIASDPSKQIAIDNVLISDGGILTGPFGTQLKVGEFVRSGNPIYGIENVLPNQFSAIATNFITDEKFKQLSRYQVLPGDVLLTRMGTVGRACVVPNNIPKKAIISYHLFRLRSNQDICLPEFLAATINFSPYVAHQLKNFAAGAVMSGLNGDIVRSVMIFLPDKELQHKFVEIVEQQISQSKILVDSQSTFDKLQNSLLDRAFTSELTASWRIGREDKLQRSAVERDKKLGLRGEKPRLIDYKIGRVTPEEVEQFRQAIQPLSNSAIQAVANAYQPILQDFSQNLFKQANFTTFANEVLKGLPDLTNTFQEVAARSVGVLDQVMRRSLSNISNMLEAVTVPLGEAFRQSTESFYLSLANQLSQIALAPPPQPNRAIHENLDELTSDVLRMAQFASTYFRPEDLADDEISPVQIESSLHLLETLGFVRQVELDGRLAYRLVDEKAEVISKPDGLSL